MKKMGFVFISFLCLTVFAMTAFAEDWICSFCGTKNESNFCMNCGKARGGAGVETDETEQESSLNQAESDDNNLEQYLGGPFSKICSDIPDLEKIKDVDGEVKWQNEDLTVTGTDSENIVRIHFQQNSSYKAYGISVSMEEKSALAQLQGVWKFFGANDEGWKVYEKEDTYLAYQSDGDKITDLYLAGKGYLPITVESETSPQELSVYLGSDFEETISAFDNMSEPTWANGVTTARNDEISFGNSGTEENGVTRISLIGKDSPYTLFGVFANMSADEISNILISNGFVTAASSNPNYTCAFYKKEGENLYSLVMANYDDEIRLIAEKNSFGPHSDKTDVFELMGCSVEDVEQRIEGLTVFTEESGITLAMGDQLILYAEADPDNPEESLINRITIQNSESDFCIYGLCPGDSWDTALETGFEEGGSGELIDPFNHVLVMYYSNDTPAKIILH